jgi:hypothetical protein
MSVDAHHGKHHREYEEQVGGGDPQVIPEYGVDNSYHQQGGEPRPTWPDCGVNLTLSALLSRIMRSFCRKVLLRSVGNIPQI